MSTPSISDLTAAQLSNAAYGSSPIPPGWTQAFVYSTLDGTSSVTVYLNGNNAVFAFKGSDNLSNFKSDLSDDGGSAWKDLRTVADAGFDRYSSEGYNVIATGHSLGGGMAQTFALENNVSGYGQNSLPVSGSAQQLDFPGQNISSVIANWKASGNTFSETNLVGDPATAYYAGGTYINTNTTTLDNSWATVEAVGVATLAVAPTDPVAVAAIGYAAYKSHSIDSVVSALADQRPVDSNLAQTINIDSSAITQAVRSTTLSGTDTSLTATASNGQQVNVSSVFNNSAYDTYTVNASGQAAQTWTGIKESGANLNESNATIDFLRNTNATASGSNNTIIGEANTTINVGGNGSTSSAIDTVYNGTNVNIENNSRVNVFDSNGTVTAGQNDNYGAYGNNITVNNTENSSVWVGGNGVGGIPDRVNAGGGTVTEADGSSVTVNAGSGGTIYESSNDVLVNSASSDMVNVQGTNDSTENDGTGDHTIVTGTQDNTQNMGSSDVTENKGSFDVTTNYGNSDVTRDEGSNEQSFNDGSNESTYSANSTDSNYDANSSDEGDWPGDPGTGYGYYGYYGLSAASSVTGKKGGDIASIAQYDLNNHDSAGAAAAEKGFQEVQSVLSAGANIAFTGAKWNTDTITWSLASIGGTVSGSLDAAEEATAQQAFATWANASGINFKEIGDSSQSDIKIGLSDFDTSNTGIVGYTSYQTNKGGAIQAGALIRVEDPTQDVLTPNSSGQYVYDGTDATFSQVLLHEIGHALGLADDADTHSIESAYLGSDDTNLDSNDISAIQQLYRSREMVKQRQSVDQLVQSMGGFASTSAAVISRPTVVAANDGQVHPGLVAFQR